MDAVLVDGKRRRAAVPVGAAVAKRANVFPMLVLRWSELLRDVPPDFVEICHCENLPFMIKCRWRDC